MSVSKLHLFVYGAELTTLSDESIDYFGVKVDRHYDVHVSEACPSSPEVTMGHVLAPGLQPITSSSASLAGEPGRYEGGQLHTMLPIVLKFSCFAPERVH